MMDRLRVFLSGTSPVMEARCRLLALKTARQVRADSLAERRETMEAFSRFMAECDLAARMARAA